MDVAHLSRRWDGDRGRMKRIRRHWRLCVAVLHISFGLCNGKECLQASWSDPSVESEFLYPQGLMSVLTRQNKHFMYPSFGASGCRICEILLDLLFLRAQESEECCHSNTSRRITTSEVDLFAASHSPQVRTLLTSMMPPQCKYD